ncbi:MAG: glycoside hydrolase family 57 protein [Candidatus Omnitrophota bacterium]
MLYLAIIYHMHQPYYKNLLTVEASVPWVRLHGVKDYLDMLLILKDYPKMRLTFNLVPGLIEQLDDYSAGLVKDKYLLLSYKNTEQLSAEDKEFIQDNFFQLNPKLGISKHPRYYQLYLKKNSGRELDLQELRDLQVWFNLAWCDPYFRKNIPELSRLVEKGRFFSEEDKRSCLDKQLEILKQIIPAYRELKDSGQIEITANSYYHPIMPLLYNSNIAKQANHKAVLPKKIFSYPEDLQNQINMAVELYQEKFGSLPRGMWPSEQALSEHILGAIIQSGIKWIVADEALLFRSLKKKKRDTSYLYQPYRLKRREGELNIVFRDRHLSDLIGFSYNLWKPEDAVSDFLGHLRNIAKHFKNKNLLVVVALDGENAWEHYKNDGWDFLSLFYQQLSKADFLQTVTISEYLDMFVPVGNISNLSPGSWVYGDFNKWIGSNPKNTAWDYLTQARKDLQEMLKQGEEIDKLAWKQIYIAEGSDWFWWYGDTKDNTFDELFRMHLRNFYSLLKKQPPGYLNRPII